MWEGRSLTKRKRVDWEEGGVMRCRDTEREVGGALDMPHPRLLGLAESPQPPQPWVTILQPFPWTVPSPQPQHNRVKEGKRPGSLSRLPSTTRTWGLPSSASFINEVGPGAGREGTVWRPWWACRNLLPRPAGADAAAECTDASAATEPTGGRCPEPRARVAQPTGM